MSIPKIRNLIEARVKDTGDTMTGRLTQTINGNPYYGLSDGTNNWYFQAIKADNASYIGPTSSKALKIDVDGNSSIRGSLLIEKDLSLLTGENDRYIIWDYSTEASKSGASWRIGMQGSGSGDANYFVIQTTGASTGTSETFANAIRIGMNSKDVLLSSTTNSTSKTTGALVVSGGAAINNTLTIGVSIVPDEAGGANVGTGTLPFLQTVARNHYLYSSNAYQTGRFYNVTAGTEKTAGHAQLIIGNSTSTGSIGNAKGTIAIYGDLNYYASIGVKAGLTDNRNLTLPDVDGVIATMNTNKFVQKDLIYDLSSYSKGNPDHNLKTWMSSTGKIILRPQSDGAQDVWLIPTQYDNVFDVAGLVIGGPQGNEYLWTLGPLLTNNKVVFHRRYDTTGTPKAAGGINGDRVLEYRHNPAGELDTSALLTVYAPADVNGVCPVLGGGAATIVAAGEAYSSFPTTAWSELGYTASSESLFLVSDGATRIFTNCNTIANRVQTAIFDGNISKFITIRGNSYQQYDSATESNYEGRLTRITSTAPSCTTANLMAWAW